MATQAHTTPAATVTNAMHAAVQALQAALVANGVPLVQQDLHYNVQPIAMGTVTHSYVRAAVLTLDHGVTVHVATSGNCTVHVPGGPAHNLAGLLATLQLAALATGA
jgi:hypothetical protein